MENDNSTIARVNNLINNSLTFKLAVITFMGLLLLIPASLIQALIKEREELKDKTSSEVSSKWAGDQTINGPILSIPVVYESGKEELWHLLPNLLQIDATVEPETLKRGIYKVVVYKSQLRIKGHFKLDQKSDEIHLKETLFDQAFLTIGISDMRGIQNQIKVQWNERKLNVNPGSKLTNLIHSGITVPIPDFTDILDQQFAFDFVVELQGSQNISFIPLGSNTEVTMKSTWQTPSFNGNFLPDSRQVNEDGFEATWSILQLNRNYPQTWTGTSILGSTIIESAFGVDMILPIDDYQKSYRSAKYSAMIIALTFLIFFLVEVLGKKKIHPFQYGLVGLALCLFYTLLVSISEQSNFNLAYGISTAGIVVMITLYSISFFKSWKLSLFLVSTLLGIYGFVFVTLQLADYALLMGSIGLTIILALTMYLTRKINWYTASSEVSQ